MSLLSEQLAFTTVFKREIDAFSPFSNSVSLGLEAISSDEVRASIVTLIERYMNAPGERAELSALSLVGPAVFYEMFRGGLVVSFTGNALDNILRLPTCYDDYGIASAARVLPLIGLMFDSGVNIFSAFEAIAVDANDDETTSLVAALQGSVMEGRAMADAAAAFPQVVPVELVESVRAGELDGSLVQVLLGQL